MLKVQNSVQEKRKKSKGPLYNETNSFRSFWFSKQQQLYSMFLDVLSEFLVQYKNDLLDWLFILLTRLLQRLSTDILQSSQTKIARVLDIVR